MKKQTIVDINNMFLQNKIKTVRMKRLYKTCGSLSTLKKCKLIGIEGFNKMIHTSKE